MKKEIMEKWVAALRSGEYKQGKYSLHSEGKFCCLGVLCEVALRDGVPVGVRGGGLNIVYDGAVAVLPKRVQDWADMASDSGTMESSPQDGFRPTLTLLNDDEGKSFVEIAAIIERNYKEL